MVGLLARRRLPVVLLYTTSTSPPSSCVFTHTLSQTRLACIRCPHTYLSQISIVPSVYLPGIGQDLPIRLYLLSTFRSIFNFNVHVATLHHQQAPLPLHFVIFFIAIYILLTNDIACLAYLASVHVHPRHAHLRLFHHPVPPHRFHRRLAID
ncbi:hypothetical protein BD309DRAFT_254919 [Dichomitus squalens]|uniref:Uncharacterized protein n=1 Tax=Dichomitus squalens TaxID=114155 RepID=A0A4Q9Q9X0_9APHY|nr:hypothetical protein BD309DRAFT_254919 [Dichomitus squalens]TBU64335.1 hypothetical protein BD310DRAFT_393509 [Dichomitus squalens]